MRAPVSVHATPSGARRYLAPRANGLRLHGGDDLATRGGAPVIAPERGVVLYAYDDADSAPATGGWAWRGYGPALVMLHGESGAFHLLAHMSPHLLVSAGDVVDEGAQLGVVDAGASHLHWEVRSMPVPPHGRAVVEITSDPQAWLLGYPRLYTHADGCPPSPGNDWHTPWGCRPANQGAAEPMGDVLPFAAARPDRARARG